MFSWPNTHTNIIQSSAIKFHFPKKPILFQVQSFMSVRHQNLWVVISGSTKYIERALNVGCWMLFMFLQQQRFDLILFRCNQILGVYWQPGNKRCHTTILHLISHTTTTTTTNPIGPSGQWKYLQSILSFITWDKLKRWRWVRNKVQ